MSEVKFLVCLRITKPLFVRQTTKRFGLPSYYKIVTVSASKKREITEYLPLVSPQALVNISKIGFAIQLQQNIRLY